MLDIFKQSFLEGYTDSITTTTVIVSLCITFLLGVYVFFIYRLMTKKTFYSKNFNISLVALALITAAVIVTIQSSVVVSLGMVGALSIVRFRTAIKDPMDLVFLFWSISIGIICGAGLAQYAVILSIIATIAIFVLNRIPTVKAPMILVINSTNIDSEQDIMAKVKEYSKYNTIKSRNLTPTSINMTVELRTNDGGKLVRELMKLKGVVSANLLTHNGEVTF